MTKSNKPKSTASTRDVRITNKFGIKGFLLRLAPTRVRRCAASRGPHQSEQGGYVQQTKERNRTDDRPEHSGILSKPGKPFTRPASRAAPPAAPSNVPGDHENAT